MGYSQIGSHKSMVFDKVRNGAFKRALERIITPDSIVLDLGAGLGVLGFLAASLGAKKVYLIEPEEVIAIGREISQQYTWADRLHFIQGRAEDIELAEKVDIIISVFAGNFLLEEDLLSSLFSARDRYLKPGGSLVPNGGLIEAVPVEAPEIFEKEIAAWSEDSSGIDFSPARNYAANTIYYRREDLANAGYLSDPMTIFKLDFLTSNEAFCETEVDFNISKDGVCHGIAGWHQINLGEEWLSSAPHDLPVHWSPAYLPLDPPIELKKGDEVGFKLSRPQNGEWSWKVEHGGKSQKHSTFLAAPLTGETIKKASLKYAPKPTFEGKATEFVIGKCDGHKTVADLAALLEKEFPNKFPEDNKAFEFVRKVVKSYC